MLDYSGITIYNDNVITKGKEMNVITTLLAVLAEHEQEHVTRPKFTVSTLPVGQATAKCLSCNQHFGVMV